MSGNNPVNPTGIGWNIDDIVVQGAIRGTSSVVAGEWVALCVLDKGLVPSATSTPGTDASMFANFTKEYTSTACIVQTVGVALESIQATPSTVAHPYQIGRIQIAGRCKAMVIHSNDGSFARGDAFCLSDGAGGGSSRGTVDTVGWAQASAASTSTASTHTKTGRILGYTEEAGSTSTAALKSVIFDGVNGMGAFARVMGT